MAAKSKKNSEADYSMEEKIITLYELQQIDTKIDEINKLKGELPLEVQDIEDEVAGLETRAANIGTEIESLTTAGANLKIEIENSKALIAKYESQLDNVRNNREFDSLTKEVEYQRLEIELAEKRIKEASAELKIKKQMAVDNEALIADRRIDLESKRAELDTIDKETAKELADLQAQSDKAAAKIDERLLTAYKRIRSNAHNGLAVVTVNRDACGGCYNRIPPQRQMDIRTNKKVIVCEYCGRILVAGNQEEQ